eukprot:gene12546-26424_t
MSLALLFLLVVSLSIVMPSFVRIQDKEEVGHYQKAHQLLDKDNIRGNFRRAVIILESLAEGNGRIAADALSDLAYIYLFGSRGRVNIQITRAVMYANSSATMGSPKGRHLLAFLYRNGIGISQNLTHAYILDKIASSDSYIQSLMTIGFSHLHRFHNNSFISLHDCESAIQFYYQGAIETIKIIKQDYYNDFISIKPLQWEIDRLGYDLNIRNARDLETINYWNFESERKNPRAFYELGKIYQYGLLGNRRDISLAILYFEKAALLNHIEAQSELGRLYSLGHGVSLNLNLALEYLKSAADANEPSALYTLGSLLQQGLFKTDDPNLAMSYLQQAVTIGSSDSEYELGKIELNKGNIDIAIQYFQRGYMSNHMKSTFALAEIYYNHSINTSNDNTNTNANININNINSKKSCKRAVYMYKRICESGYWSDNGVREAVREYRAGREFSALLLSLLSADEGINTADKRSILHTAKSKTVAVDMLKLVNTSTSSEFGRGLSSLLLGDSYRKGQGCPRNLTAAVVWYENAVQMGDTLGMERLASMLVSGAGSMQDLERAEVLLTRAYVSTLDSSRGGISVRILRKRFELLLRIIHVRKQQKNTNNNKSNVLLHDSNINDNNHTINDIIYEIQHHNKSSESNESSIDSLTLESLHDHTSKTVSIHAISPFYMHPTTSNQMLTSTASSSSTSTSINSSEAQNSVIESNNSNNNNNNSNNNITNDIELIYDDNIFDLNNEIIIDIYSNSDLYDSNIFMLIDVTDGACLRVDGLFGVCDLSALFSWATSNTVSYNDETSTSTSTSQMSIWKSTLKNIKSFFNRSQKITHTKNNNSTATTAYDNNSMNNNNDIANIEFKEGNSTDISNSSDDNSSSDSTEQFLVTLFVRGNSSSSASSASTSSTSSTGEDFIPCLSSL